MAIGGATSRWIEAAALAAMGLAAVLLASRPIAAETDDGVLAARQLLEQVRSLNKTSRAWKDRTQRIQLTIIDRRRNERQREMKVITKKFEGDETRTILFFLAPVEVRGVGLLQWSAPHQEDTQWFQLPEQQPRRISGNSKRDSFVGTDFTFEDLTIWADVLDWNEEDAHATLLRSEPLQGQNCAVIEMVPSGVQVSYQKIRLWLGRDDQVIHRMEFDERDTIVKTLDLTDVRPVGKIPVAHRLEMHNVRGGSSTVVVMTAVDFDTGVADEEFTQRRLQKGI